MMLISGSCRAIQYKPLSPVFRRINSQSGIALVVSLLMLIVILMLGISGTRMALQAEKISRNDRDRQIAFQAADAALADAELDIEGHGGERNRGHMFSSTRLSGFPDSGCEGGMDNPALGLCALHAEGAMPAWLELNALDGPDGRTSVPYGHFSGNVFPVGEGSLPARVPRYIIEPFPDTADRGATREDRYVFRITSIGFGAIDTTQVVLQSIYRKADATRSASRLSWREIINWNDIRK